MGELNLPAPGAKILHVAGTNGKGSTCALAEAALRAAGHRTGHFTSPHLDSYRERIRIGGQPIDHAIHEQSVTLRLEDDIDISRGDMIVKAAEVREPLKQIDVTLCWMSETPMSPARTYVVRHTTREVKAKILKIDHRLDVNTLEHEPVTTLAMNDIATLTLKLAQPVFADPYRENRATGAFIVIDESTNNTVGAGMIR